MSASSCDSQTFDRAAVTRIDAAQLARTFFPLLSVDETLISEMDGYDDRNFRIEGVRETDGDGASSREVFVMKVTNRKESANVDLIDAQNDFMSHLRSRGLPCPRPLLTRGGDLRVLHAIPHPDCTEGDPVYAIRLLTFLSGELLADVEQTDVVLRHVGEVIGNISVHLKDFPRHKAVDERNYLWNLAPNLTLTRPYIPAVDTKQKRQLVTEVIDAFESHVLPVLKTLPMNYIHGDLNDRNILMGKADETGQRRVSGIIDYGDIVLSYRVADIAIAMAYAAIGKKNGLKLVSRHILAGYHNVHPLSAQELDILYYLITGRLCQTCVLSSFYYSLHPTNDYLLVHAWPAWETLQEIWSQRKEDVDGMLRDAYT